MEAVQFFLRISQIWQSVEQKHNAQFTIPIFLSEKAGWP